MGVWGQKAPKEISIHAPHGGSDAFAGDRRSRTAVFLSTLPMGGATLVVPVKEEAPKAFLSTLPMGGATSAPAWALQKRKYFYPRSPWGERQQNYINILKGILTE